MAVPEKVFSLVRSPAFYVGECGSRYIRFANRGEFKDLKDEDIEDTLFSVSGAIDTTPMVGDVLIAEFENSWWVFEFMEVTGSPIFYGKVKVKAQIWKNEIQNY